MSIDGYIDDASDRRLVLSNEADLDRVDEVRASCDAILVGAGTIRRDNPSLLVRSVARRQGRCARGLPPSPVRVTLTGRGDLDPAARFFTSEAVMPGRHLPGGTVATASSRPAGPGQMTDDQNRTTAGGGSRIVFAGSAAAGRTAERLGAAADVVDAGDPVDLSFVLAFLHARGIRRLMVEGGSSVHTQFLTAGLADELRLAVAPLFVGDSRAPRFVADGGFRWNPGHPARLAEVCRIGDLVALTYALSGQFGSPPTASGQDRTPPS
jgi:5-amino-6-(5-phosphoribosylamino)uracil reductase